MWPELIQRWMDRQRGARAGNLPPLETYQDTLRYLANGMPEIVQHPMKDGLYGTYDPKIPTLTGTIGGVQFRTENGRMRDTISLNSAPQSEPLPYDFVLAHEMGHKIFDEARPDAIAQSQMLRDGEGVRKIAGYVARDGGNASEDFARAFAVSMERVRGSDYKAPEWSLQGVAPIYIDMIRKWATQKLNNYDRKW